MENNEKPVENINTGNNTQDIVPKKTNNKKKSLIIITIILVIIALGIFIFFKVKVNKNNSKPDDNKENIEVKRENKYSAYQLKDNKLSNFDLYFLQLENNKQNMIYSPLSIKYVLEMLSSGTDGESKYQIDDILGTYTNKKYTNNKNMSFANALFVRNSYKDNIKTSYVDTLKDKYNAEVIYDDFKNVNTINKWVSDKTYKLINNLYDDISDNDFILANALGIDMEWINKIQDEEYGYYTEYAHEKFSKIIQGLELSDYTGINFTGYNKKAKAVEIGAVANKYNIIKELGEDNIRKKVTEEYDKWLKNQEEEMTMCGSPDNLDEADKLDLDKYFKELKENYQQISSSTDFEFYTDSETKVFAKDLKTYNGTTLQYIGIMPTQDNLSTYIKNINADKINTLISNLKPIELNSFKDGVITEIFGYIPMFKFDYELKLVNDLNTLGIKDVFDSDKANLSNLTSDKAYISNAKHKANIEFSNEGIKAAAATSVGGAGGGMCGFDYKFDVPVEKIDLTFANPYMFIIRDKDTGEVWFTGTVYEPIEFVANHGF